ncbi:MAG: hypothetical protein ABH873_05525 [Candidatus Firestonebacteria bacterium]
MKTRMVLIFSLLFLQNIFAEEIRLDKLPNVKITFKSFKESKDGWHVDKIIQEKTNLYLQINFPKIVTVTKIILDLPLCTIESNLFTKKEIPGLYNFEILCNDTTYKEMKSIRKYKENSYKNLEIKEKFKTDTIKIVVFSYREGMDRYFGGINKIAVYGYEGNEPLPQKKGKTEIKTKEDAKEAFRNGEITPKEYLEYLKK